MSKMTKEEVEALKKELLAEPENGYARISGEDLAAMEEYCREYISFIGTAKTERECVTESVRMAEAAGFRPFERGQQLKPGDRVYRVNRKKAVMFAVIGSEPLSAGVNIVASHIDSPRLDLKPNPLYEDGGIALLKTHYYGGIKKYQWTTVPLELRGVVVRKDGSAVTVSIGSDPADPVFTISDLLIHLASEQMKKTLADGVSGEALNVLFGSRPLDGEGSDRVKLAVMKLLNEKYGLIEEDFLSAELSLVPAYPARELGLDRSFIGAYGHDDRVCAFAALHSMLSLKTPARSCVCVLADKEEIGSEGVSGMQSQAFDSFIQELCSTQGVDPGLCLGNSCCLSSDVTNAFDPSWAEVSDKRNNARVNYGACIMKYTGARGKSGASDASAELMGKLRGIFNDNDVIWQTGELGKIDQGGGGTVAAFMARRNIDTVDAGVPVLSMHAPFEVVAKLDCYMTRKACLVFYEKCL